MPPDRLHDARPVLGDGQAGPGALHVGAAPGPQSRQLPRHALRRKVLRARGVRGSPRPSPLPLPLAPPPRRGCALPRGGRGGGMRGGRPPPTPVNPLLFLFKEI